MSDKQGIKITFFFIIVVCAIFLSWKYVDPRLLWKISTTIHPMPVFLLKVLDSFICLIVCSIAYVLFFECESWSSEYGHNKDSDLTYRQMLTIFGVVMLYMLIVAVTLFLGSCIGKKVALFLGIYGERGAFAMRIIFAMFFLFISSSAIYLLANRFLPNKRLED